MPFAETIVAPLVVELIEGSGGVDGGRPDAEVVQRLRPELGRGRRQARPEDARQLHLPRFSRRQRQTRWGRGREEVGIMAALVKWRTYFHCFCSFFCVVCRVPMLFWPMSDEIDS